MSKSKPAKKKTKPPGSLRRIKVEAEGCRRCPLWEHATQTVFGSGSANGPLMLVGEQPGDVEDRQGEPSSAPPASCSAVRSARPASTWPACI